MKLNVKIKKIGNSFYIGSCPDLPGCHIQAQSREDAERKLREAIRLMVLSFKQHYEKVPIE